MREVPGFVVRGLRPVGTGVPPLDDAGALPAWRALLQAEARPEAPRPVHEDEGDAGADAATGPGAPAAIGRPVVYLRFEDTALPLGPVRRLAALAELWVECRPRSLDDCVDLTMAGAARVAVRPEQMEDLDGALEEMGPSLLVWGRPGRAQEDAARLAPHGAALLLDAPPAQPVPGETYVATMDGHRLRLQLLTPTDGAEE